jgi:hypothetical protein
MQEADPGRKHPATGAVEPSNTRVTSEHINLLVNVSEKATNSQRPLTKRIQMINCGISRRRTAFASGCPFFESLIILTVRHTSASAYKLLKKSAHVLPEGQCDTFVRVNRP